MWGSGSPFPQRLAGRLWDQQGQSLLLWQVWPPLTAVQPGFRHKSALSHGHNCSRLWDSWERLTTHTLAWHTVWGINSNDCPVDALSLPRAPCLCTLLDVLVGLWGPAPPHPRQRQELPAILSRLITSEPGLHVGDSNSLISCDSGYSLRRPLPTSPPWELSPTRSHRSMSLIAPGTLADGLAMNFPWSKCRAQKTKGTSEPTALSLALRPLPRPSLALSPLFRVQEYELPRFRLKRLLVNILIGRKEGKMGR